jgi:hypothetical protein
MQTLPFRPTPRHRLPTTIRLAIVSSSDRWSEGNEWRQEVKYVGHRIVAVVDGHGGVKLISRNRHDRTPLFRTVSDQLSCGREIVLDGEIAVSDDRGVTHVGHLLDARDGRQPDRVAYFVFDLLYLDGRDLRRNPIEESKARLRRVFNRARCPRQVSVDHVLGWGAELLDHVRAIGAEGIATKRAVSLSAARPRVTGARPSATPPADLSLPASSQNTRSFNKHCANHYFASLGLRRLHILTKVNPVYVTRMPGGVGGLAL